MELRMNINGQVITIIEIYGMNYDANADEKYEFFKTLGDHLNIVGDLNCGVSKEN